MPAAFTNARNSEGLGLRTPIGLDLPGVAHSGAAR